MQVTARLNTPGPTTFNDWLPTKTTTVRYWNNTTSVEDGYAQRVTHYCARSASRSMPLESILGSRKRIRRSSNFERTVMDCLPTPLIRDEYTFNPDGSKRQWRRIERAFDLPYGDVSFYSRGYISGYAAVRSNDAINNAITKALNKLGDGKASLGAALAESRSTFNMIADTSSALLRAYRAVKRGNLREAAKYLGVQYKDIYTFRSSAKAWLQLKYGWLPLMQDIHEGYNYLRDLSGQPLLLRVQEGAVRTDSFSATTSRFSMNYQVKQVGYCGITAAVTGDFARGFNQGGLLNPLEVAWEVVPFSFLLDWFVPVGNVLQSYSGSAGLAFVDGYVGDSNEVTVSATSRYLYTPPGSYVVENGKGVVRYFSHKRTALGGFPQAGAYVKGKWFGNNNDKLQDKGLTALALYRQVVVR